MGFGAGRGRGGGVFDGRDRWRLQYMVDDRKDAVERKIWYPLLKLCPFVSRMRKRWCGCSPMWLAPLNCGGAYIAYPMWLVLEWEIGGRSRNSGVVYWKQLHVHAREATVSEGMPAAARGRPR